MLVMDSVPPATTMSAQPVRMVCVPRMMAFKLEAQTLLTVVQTVVSERPALMAHWRAGFWPKLWKRLAFGVLLLGGFAPN